MRECSSHISQGEGTPQSLCAEPENNKISFICSETRVKMTDLNVSVKYGCVRDPRMIRKVKNFFYTNRFIWTLNERKSPWKDSPGSISHRNSWSKVESADFVPKHHYPTNSAQDGRTRANDTSLERSRRDKHFDNSMYGSRNDTYPWFRGKRCFSVSLKKQKIADLKGCSMFNRNPSFQHR